MLSKTGHLASLKIGDGVTALASGNIATGSSLRSQCLHLDKSFPSKRMVAFLGISDLGGAGILDGLKSASSTIAFSSFNSSIGRSKGFSINSPKDSLSKGGSFLKCERSLIPNTPFSGTFLPRAQNTAL